MTSKTISITKEAYERLKARKGEHKSFTEVVMELTKGERNDFSSLIDTEVDLDWEKVKKEREKSKKDEEREKILLGH